MFVLKKEQEHSILVVEYYGERTMSKKRKKSRCQALVVVVFMFSVFAITLSFVVRSPEIVQWDSEDQLSHRQRFFETIRSDAQTNQEKYGVFASITMAQAALESNFGSSQLSAEYGNLFGVKGTPSQSVALSTKEYINNKWVDTTAYFKRYNNWAQSISDHGYLLRYGTSWNKQQYQAVLIAKNYQEAAHGLVKSGYATDPTYAQKIIDMIEKYQLHQYDLRQ